jgi:hypothetical protein
MDFRGAVKRRDLSNPEHLARVHQPYPDEISLSFSAFGESFNFTLSVQRQSVEHDGFVEFIDENGREMRIPHEIKSYSSNHGSLAINAVVHDDRTVHAIVNHPNVGIFQVESRSKHQDDLPLHRRDEFESSDFVAFRLTDIDETAHQCGVTKAWTQTTAKTSSNTLFYSAFVSHDVTPAAPSLHSRGIVTDAQKNSAFIPALWSDCYPQITTPKRNQISFLIDTGTFRLARTFFMHIMALQYLALPCSFFGTSFRSLFQVTLPASRIMLMPPLPRSTT